MLLGAIASTVAFGWVGALACVPAAGVWWLGTRWMSHATAAWVFGTAAWLHLAVAASGFHSNDLHRYLLEGHAQLEGYSPYTTAPAETPLAALRDRGSARVPHAELPSPYPPLAQATFVLAALVGASELDYRNGILLLNLATVGLLLGWLRATGRPVGRAAYYAWSPVAVVSACGGHVDVVMLAALVGFVWAWESDRGRLAGCLLGAAVLAKVVAVLVLPWAVWRRPRPVLATALPILALGYAPYLGAGQMWGSLPALALEFRFNGPVYELFVALLGGFAPAAAALLLALIAGLIASRVPAPADATALAMVGLLLLAPVVHYWYLTWFLVLLPGVRGRALRWGGLAWAASVCVLTPLYLAIARGEALPAAGPWLAVELLLPSCAVAAALWCARPAARGDLPGGADLGPLRTGRASFEVTRA